MNLTFTILFAFAMGFFVKPRGLAIATYLAIDAILFSYQTLSVLLEWLGGNDHGFGDSPSRFPVTFANSQLIAYGVVNLAIMCGGVGLVVAGGRVAARRAAKHESVAVV